MGSIDTDAPRWDLRSLYSEEAEQQIFSDLKEAVQRAEAFFAQYRHSLVASNPNKILQALRDYEAIMQLASKPLQYAKLHLIEHMADGQRTALFSQVKEAYRKILEKTDFFLSTLKSLSPEVRNALASSKELSQYSGFLKELVLLGPFALPYQEEEAFRQSRESYSLAYDRGMSTVLVNLQTDTGPQQLTAVQALSALYSPKASFREKAFVGLLKSIEDKGALFADLLNDIVSSKIKESSKRGITPPWAEMLLVNRMEPHGFGRVLEAVAQAYSIIEKYFELKAGALGVRKLQIWDIYAPIDSDTRIPFTEARSWVLEALQGIGPAFPAFYERAKECFEGKRIHAAADKWKEPSARCLTMTPSVPCYINISYNGGIRDVLLLAHELGHAIHYALAASQSHLNYMPLDFVSETAAMFFENAIATYLMNSRLPKLNEVTIMGAVLDSTFLNLFRQHSIAVFERKLYAQRESGRLSSEEICEIWMKTQFSLFGGSVDICPEYRWAWAIIPHLFHRPFYCVSYVFGYMAALLLLEQAEEDQDTVHELIEALGSGRKCSPVDLLQIAGVNNPQSVPWDKALGFIYHMLERFEQLATKSQTTPLH